MRIKFNNRTDKDFGYYSFHREYRDAILPATEDRGGYLVKFPDVVGIAEGKTDWWYSSDVVEVVDG